MSKNYLTHLICVMDGSTGQNAKAQKRNHISIAQRREALRLLDEGISKKNVAEKYNVSRTALVKWLSRRNEYTDFKGNAKASRMKKGGRPPKIPFAASLKEYMELLREKEKALSVSHIINFIKENQAEWFEAYRSNKTNPYKAALRLLERFAHRHGFSRQRSSTLKLNKAELEQIRADFGAHYHQEYMKFDLHSQYNVDETGIYADMPPSSIWSKKGKGAKISAGEKHSYRMTAVLTIRADGMKLPILFIMRGEKNGSIEKEEFSTFPQGHYYVMQKKAWMNRKVWEEYLEDVLKPCIEEPSVILVDNFDAHVSDESREVIEEQWGCRIAQLPPNATSHCQPLDVSIMGPFKQHMRDFYLAETVVARTKAEKRLMMIRRAIAAWERITEDEVRASWTKAIPHQV